MKMIRSDAKAKFIGQERKRGDKPTLTLNLGSSNILGEKYMYIKDGNLAIFHVLRTDRSDENLKEINLDKSRQDLVSVRGQRQPH